MQNIHTLLKWIRIHLNVMPNFGPNKKKLSNIVQCEYQSLDLDENIKNICFLSDKN